MSSASLKTTVTLLTWFAAAPFFGAYASEPQATEVAFDFRYRLEYVDQENPLQRALASTLRSRMTVNTDIARLFQVAPMSGLSALVEIDNVSNIGGQRFNSTVNGHNDYSVVADPEGTDVNQAFLSYRFSQQSSITAGRQRVNYLNQRFLGGVGWRQNEQTFDGYRYQHALSNISSLDVGYFHNVNRIFGPDGSSADHKGNFYTSLFTLQPAAGHQAAAFYYDFEFSDWQERSSRTYGIDYSLAFAAPWALKAQMTLARQDDAHQNTQNFTHSYHRLSIDWDFGPATLTVGQERLAGNGDSALQTPLATLHAFNGFADIFLNTPADGLRDDWLALKGQHHKWKWRLAYHDFRADHGAHDYGDELDLTAQYVFSHQLSLLLKLASYQADSLAVDTNKAWFMLSYKH
ncbi:alginate export family protein [Pseudidiomarina insulisalsae]|uniref:Uncharacterized protein n=1 Tax=Pseudidiomarina insulisalsae TaxID=575789 RepID=A0A432YPZ3_9GAMM|nr:alginate export family protein [Pseudidiomarina insulisalsae]RUO63133.1 hypothetical protein CWI71_02610 [Pseudidiomarina insulisalsae]